MCGLFGLVSKDVKTFDSSTFFNLGILNDSRGGDSCGYFIDGHTEYGVGKEDSFFECFFQGNEFLQTLEESSVALGHCRKASVGIISKETAQPVVIRKNKRVEFVLMHNGTITNYKRLASKYIPKTDITGLTDSQIMARIFYETGYKALSEYEGAAVFVIADYRKNSKGLYLFKGMSKKFFWDKTLSDERPLYYCLDNGELVFSSIYSGLMACRRGSRVYSLKGNELIRFDGEKLVSVMDVDRPEPPKWETFDTEYISPVLSENIYTLKGKSITGTLKINEFGRIITNSKKGKYVYFFNGVLLKNKKCFSYLSELYARQKLPFEEFVQNNRILIRFLSRDPVFPEQNLWYEATSQDSGELFSGTLEMMASFQIQTFVNGERLPSLVRYTGSESAFKTYDRTDPNKLLKTCMK